MKALAAFAHRFRAIILGTTAVLTLFFAYELKNVRIETDLSKSFPKSDKTVQLYDRVGRLFGSNDIAVAIMTAPDVFEPETISKIAELTAKFKAIDGVMTVTSLTDVIDIRKSETGDIEIGKLIDPNHIPKSQSELDRIKSYALGKDIYRGRLVSPNADATLIMMVLSPGFDGAEMNAQLDAVVKSAGLENQVHIGGNPRIMSEIQLIVKSDLVRLIPLVLILTLLALWLFFRSFRGVLVPILAVTISTVWTIGLMGLTHVPFTVIGDIIPVLLIAIGTAPCIHILSKFNETPALYGSRNQATVDALGEVGFRVLIASLTIILGFASFIFGTYLTLLRDFGIFMCVGVFFTLVISILAVPAFLSFLRAPKRPKVDDISAQPSHSGRRDALVNKVLSHKMAIFAVFAILLLIGLMGTPRIRRTVDFIDFFDEASDIRQTTRLIEQYFGGSKPLNIFVEGDLQSPCVLKEMRRLQKFIEAKHLAFKPLSPADLIAEMNDVVADEKIIPDDKAKLSNLWFLLEGQDIVSTISNGDKNLGLITGTVRSMDIPSLHHLIDTIGDYTGNLDRRYYELEMSSLSPKVRESVAQYRVGRVIEEIAWDAERRLPGVSFEKEALRSLVSGAEGPALPDEQRVSELLAAVSASLPSVFTRNPQFMADLKNDLAELKQSRIAVPERLYLSLGLASNPQAESTSIAMAQADFNVINRDLDNALIESQVESTIIAVVVIFVMLFLLLRSWALGLVGLIPILVTIALMFGVMGLAQIPLNMATILIGSIALGIGVDYSIHFTLRYQFFYRTSGDIKDALAMALGTTGGAILTNALAVSVGFVTLLFGQLGPIKHFGILVTLAMVGCCMGALTLLPASILSLRLAPRTSAPEQDAPGDKEQDAR